jgi:osmotically-inducible protein OsmY
MFNFFSKTDSQIQKDVLNEIKWDPSVGKNQVSVSSTDGIVTLRGNVPHYFEKIKIEAAAQRVGGVRAVADELEVEIMGSFERTDEQIAEAALFALEWNYSAPRGLTVTVEKGWITLKGEAEWDYQRKAAKNSLVHLMGVAGVSNYITLKEKILPSDIKIRIQEALKRSAESEGSKINVEVSGTKVILSGNVHSFKEIEDAASAAWNAPGVMALENNLKIFQ